jgi:murein DD-endopeptidase MepM/ murein hydrolase activator NlpD
LNIITRITFLLLVLCLSFSCKEKEKSGQISVPAKTVHKYKYGIIIDSLRIITAKVQDGESFSVILQKNGIGYPLIDTLVKSAKNIFDFNNIRPGKSYSFLIARNDSTDVKYFIYELNRIDFVVIGFGDSLRIYKSHKKVDTVLKKSSGVITYSLWNAMLKNDINPQLALDLSDIYAWTIDFFGIQEGDKFKAYYEELYADGKSAGFGKIHAAWFEHYGKEYYAFYFKYDTVESYYNENAQNLKREFLKAPLHFSRLSSRFSHSRLHPILKIRRPHYGVDYAAPIGTPVHSIADGKVVYTGRRGGAGKMIKVKHKGSYTSSYLHLSGYAKGIKRGAKVRQGQTIGYVGSTGLSTGPHLDFRIYNAGRPVNPLKVQSDPLEPVDSVYMDKFKRLKKSLMDTLKKIEIINPEKQQDSVNKKFFIKK